MEKAIYKKRIQPEIIVWSSKFGMIFVTEAHMDSKFLQGEGNIIQT